MQVNSYKNNGYQAKKKEKEKKKNTSGSWQYTEVLWSESFLFYYYTFFTRNWTFFFKHEQSGIVQFLLHNLWISANSHFVCLQQRCWLSFYESPWTKISAKNGLYYSTEEWKVTYILNDLKVRK